VLDQALANTLHLIRAGKYSAFFPQAAALGKDFVAFCRDSENESLLTRRFRMSTFGLYDETTSLVPTQPTTKGRVTGLQLAPAEVKSLQQAYAASDGAGQLSAWDTVFNHPQIAHIVELPVAQIACRTNEGAKFVIAKGGFYAVDLANDQGLKRLPLDPGCYRPSTFGCNLSLSTQHLRRSSRQGMLGSGLRNARESLACGPRCVGCKET
jgi:hypothetical protein